MEKNKMIICVLIIIIIALLVGILLTMPNFSKTDSNIQIEDVMERCLPGMLQGCMVAGSRKME